MTTVKAATGFNWNVDAERVEVKRIEAENIFAGGFGCIYTHLTDKGCNVLHPGTGLAGLVSVAIGHEATTEEVFDHFEARRGKPAGYFVERTAYVAYATAVGRGEA